MATRIKEAGSLNTIGYAQLRQQFNAQFNKSPLHSSEAQRLSMFIPQEEVRFRQQLDQFKKANEPLQLSMYDMKEENEDMMSIDGSSSSDFDTVCDSDSDHSIDFESIESSESGNSLVCKLCLELPKNSNDDSKSHSTTITALSDTFCEYSLKSCSEAAYCFGFLDQ